MNGVIVIDKPFGKTSHDMVYFVRKTFGIKKVGHTGTLDPMATGVLPVCIGKATKAADMLTASDKSYTAEFVLGMTTDTLDAEGEVLTEQPFDYLTDEKIKDTVKKFIGEIYQIPPMFSAIKKDGKKLYELARKGVTVEREKRLVRIDRIDVLSIDLSSGVVKISVDCSKGTYIRTLCEDIGIALGCGAYMNSLVRTKSGGFTKSYTVDEILKLKNENKIDEILIPLDVLFGDFPKLNLTEKQTGKVMNGVRIKYGGLTENRQYRLYGADGEFIAISRFKDGLLVLEKAFWS